MSVSYTHLDVYKRQVLSHIVADIIAIKEGKRKFFVKKITKALLPIKQFIGSKDAENSFHSA